MRNPKPSKANEFALVGQLVTAKELNAMLTYIRSYQLKYSGNKTFNQKRKK